VTNMDHVVQPGPGSHVNKLWNRSVDKEDPEPIFAPKMASLRLPPMKITKRGVLPLLAPPIREEDKDPVYKYLESFMTCARVREFNSKPPPKLTIEPKILNPSKPAADNTPKMYYRSLLTGKKAAERASQGTTSSEKEAKKQIEIQSACQWDGDRKKVLEALLRRMKQNKLCRRFYVGPYRVCPIAKIFMQKPSGSIVTYR
ncbi:MAX gene-associated protein-like, partial [Plectropomus leopardus]|uniref:MAX gene-associated protein-like n=1 Tax=Plectropomus leopardus TaxID=160734 RepID=UPI001C4C6584